MQSIWFRRVEHMGCIILAHSFQTCLPLETDPPAAPRCNFNHPGLAWGFKHLWVWLTGLLFIGMNVTSQLLPTKAMGGVSRCKLFLMLLLCCDVCCLCCVVVVCCYCVLSVLHCGLQELETITPCVDLNPWPHSNIPSGVESTSQPTDKPRMPLNWLADSWGIGREVY